MAESLTHIPNYAIYAPDVGSGADLSGLVISIDYESSVDAMSEGKIVIANPDHRFTDDPYLTPGNPLDIYMGYGSDLSFVGRIELQRHMPTFPDDDAPTLEIVGHDRSIRMARQETEVGGAGKKISKAIKAESGKPWKGSPVKTVSEIMEKYGITPDVDPILNDFQDEEWVQAKGVTDLAFLRAMSNFYSAWFYVEYIPVGKPGTPYLTGKGTPFSSLGSFGQSVFSDITGKGKWVGRFLMPKSATQAEKFCFKWGEQGTGTLSKVSLEFAIESMVTEVQAYVWDRQYWRWIPIYVDDETLKKKMGKKHKPPQQPSSGTWGESGVGGKSAPMAQASELTDATAIKLETSGYAVDVLTRRFKDAAQAQAFLEAWFQSHKDGFILAEGTVPGNSKLAAGQIHRLEGLGVLYSGDYYFSVVRHKFEKGEGYTTEFSARKIVT